MWVLNTDILAGNAAIQSGPMRGGPAGTLFLGPTAIKGYETERTFECLLLTNSK